ncbi:MAG: hypothetical protein CL807_00730 [Citromicrobium sp.]|nr:hypothetical protein [Citromicrobium sp.]MAO97053.1 hypothetical protein [Citromicrobium sp.]MBD75428.1 hypothetical protein [Citromicrobium sp.]|tara:strand:+ start:9430 stop:10206 length:777 start_codon:yes stop_codon:yes gene_type:complete
MDESNAAGDSEEMPAFPFHVLWTGYGNANVTLRELEDNVEEYRILNEEVPAGWQGVPRVALADVENLLSRHQLPQRMAKHLWVSCCFYLSQKQAEASGIDPKASREMLLKAADAADKLADALANISPKVFAALYFKRPHVPDTIEPTGPNFGDLYSEIHDFALVADNAAAELVQEGGRPRNHYRDTMFRLIIEVLLDHGLDDLVVSNGTKDRPDPHLGGQAGTVLIDLVKLVEPSWSEKWLAPKVKPVLKRVRAAWSG